MPPTSKAELLRGDPPGSPCRVVWACARAHARRQVAHGGQGAGLVRPVPRKNPPPWVEAGSVKRIFDRLVDDHGVVEVSRGCGVLQVSEQIVDQVVRAGISLTCGSQVTGEREVGGPMRQRAEQRC
jgi:hypothetical protein